MPKNKKWYKISWVDFLAELDKMNPLENKKDWYKVVGDYVLFSEISGIDWKFYSDGDLIIRDDVKETEIKVGNYDFADMLKKIEVWFK